MKREGPVQLEAFLTTDEGPFLRKYYPEFVYERPTDGYVVPRDIRTVTIPEAAQLLDMTRAGAWKLCTRGAFESLRKVGSPDKPTYLLDVTEVLQYVEAHGG